MPPTPPSLGLGLGLPFVRGGGPSLDPDAAAYIAAIQAAGADLGLLNEESITKKAISDSIIERKDLGIWDLERRTYLPIWGLPAPNAICMRSLTSGEFVNDVTHGAGFVQGDGTSGYFDTGSSLVAMGLTNVNVGLFCLLTSEHLNNSQVFIGSGGGGNNNILWRNGGGLITYRAIGSAAQETTLSGKVQGVLSGHRTATTRRTSRRDGSGRQTALTAGLSAAGTLSAGNLLALANNNRDDSGITLGTPSNSRQGAFGATHALTDADDAAFTLNLKTLWETCTGLTLP